MHSLIGDRFLKKFAGTLLRRRGHTSMDEMGEEPGDSEDVITITDVTEKEDVQEQERLSESLLMH